MIYFVINLIVYNDFLAIVRNQRKAQSPHVNNNGIVEHKPDVISELFVNHFSSVFNEQTVIPDDPPPCNLHIPKFDSIDLTEQAIKEKIQSLQNDKSPGLDGITPRLLKLCEDNYIPCFIENASNFI